MQVTDTNLTLRSHRSKKDYWRIRRFLREVLECNGGHLYSWHVSRFDCWRWSAMERRGADEAIKKLVFLWETSDGHLAAVLHPEDTGHAFLQVHPAYRTTELEEAMLSQAERHLTPEKEGRSELTVWAPEHDTMRQDLLLCRGYQKGDDPDYQGRQCLTSAPALAPLPSGYSLRALGDETEWLALGTASYLSSRRPYRL